MTFNEMVISFVHTWAPRDRYGLFMIQLRELLEECRRNDAESIPDNRKEDLARL